MFVDLLPVYQGELPPLPGNLARTGFHDTALSLQLTKQLTEFLRKCRVRIDGQGCAFGAEISASPEPLRPWARGPGTLENLVWGGGPS